MTSAKDNFSKKLLLPISTIAIASMLLMSCTTEPVAKEQQAALAQGENIGEALALYAKAWTERDTDAILARHADDTQFHLVSFGSEPVKGKAEIRKVFDALFEFNPNYKSTVRSVRLGSDFAVVEYDMYIDPNRPGQAGTTVFTPAGHIYKTPAVDIIVFKNGLVTKKITYLDTETIRANSSKVEKIQR